MNEETLRGIISEYSGLLYTVALRILKNRQEAEECAADAFIKLWETRGSIKHTDNLKGWLLCIARNNAINRYHKQKRGSSVSVDAIEGFELVSDENVELLVIKNEFMGEVQKLIMKMPESNRELMIRKYFLFESIKDIAEKTGLSETQVKDRLYRGRQRLRKELGEGGKQYAEIIFTGA